MNNKVIYCFWTGSNEMSENRKNAYKNLLTTVNCPVILVTPDNLHQFILAEHPLHEAYDYLSETHKSDVLRTYFMNFHGGGYADIKFQSGDWNQAFDDLFSSDNIICGYPEVCGGVSYRPLIDSWQLLIGNCAYICKPNTKFTNEWYAEMNKVLDIKLDELKKYPSKHPRDCKDSSKEGYPIEWSEILGKIFHPVLHSAFLDKTLRTLPVPHFDNYQ